MASTQSFDITKTAGYREAMDDIKAGRVYHADSAEVCSSKYSAKGYIQRKGRTT